MAVYIRKRIAYLIEKMEEQFTLPNKWDKFLNEESRPHNLLIKTGKQCYCTHCKLEFKSKKKIGEYEKCPFCKQKLQIRSSRLRNEEFTKDLTLLDKVEDQLIIRLFEMRSTYQYQERKFRHSTVEYGRIILNENCHLLNERAFIFMTTFNIYHKANAGKWRKYNGYCGLSSRGKLYPYNLKAILKGTIYQYSHLWDFIKKVPGCDLENLLTGVAKCPSFELLVKLKLYNLALDATTFNVKGDFKARFGVGKEYYDFMKRYDLNTEELEILSQTQTPDIKLIKYLKKQFTKYERKGISKYINLKKLGTYYKNSLDGGIYLDYLEFAEKLGMNMKDKEVLFPDNLREEHDKLADRVDMLNNKETYENVEKRYKELSKNKYEDKKYIIFPAESVTALKDESKQQNHCVQNYAERYAKAICDIYFMRLLTNQKKSVVTIEVRDNKIVQKRIKNNDLPNEEQNLFLEKWQQKILQKCRV